MKTPRRRAHGTTLIEALVAFAVLSFGALATVRLDRDLRSAAATARQRAEAVRLAEDDLEQLRSFASIAASGSSSGYAGIAAAHRLFDASALGPGSAPFRLVRDVRTAGVASAREVSVEVAWDDVDGHMHRVRLVSMIAASDPALVGTLMLAPGGAAASASVAGR